MTVLSADGTLTVDLSEGNGPNIDDQSAFYTFTAEKSEDGKNFNIVVDASATFSQVANQKNQSVAKALEGLQNSSPDSEQSKVLGQLLSLNEKDFNKSVRQLSAETHGQGAAISVSQTRTNFNQITGRLQGIRSGGYAQGDLTGMQLASGEVPSHLLLAQDDGSIERESEWSAFGKIFAQYTDQDSSDDILGYTAQTGGIVFGLDRKINENMIGGVMAGYALSEAEYESNRGENTVNSFRVGPYASYHSKDRWYVDASMLVGFNSNDAERNVTISGGGNTSTTTHESDYNAWDLSLYTGAGKDIDFGGLTLTPNGWIQYTYYTQEEFTEDGGAVATTVSEYNTSSLRSMIGLKISKEFDYKFIRYTPEINFGWAHEWLDPDDIEARFVGEVNPFTFTPGLANENAFLLSAGVNAKVDDRVSMFFKYDADISSTGQTHAGSFGLRYNF